MGPTPRQELLPGVSPNSHPRSCNSTGGVGVGVGGVPREGVKWVPSPPPSPGDAQPPDSQGSLYPTLGATFPPHPHPGGS